MARWNWITWVASIIAISILLPPAYAQAPQHVTFRGHVLDVKNQPVPGVTIRIYRGTSKLAEDSTTGDGKYDIAFAKGGAISVRYDRTNWEPAFISGLSGEYSHEINKVMFESGKGRLPFAASLDILEAYQRIYYLDRQRGVALTILKERYEPGLSRLNVPESLKWKLEETTSLYATDQPFSKIPYRPRDIEPIIRK